MDSCNVTLLGDQDGETMFNRADFSIDAGRSQFLRPIDRNNDEERLEFLRKLPRSYRVGCFLFVHGSPRNPLSEFVFPEDIYNHRKMERLFQLIEHCCFQGHTRAAGVFTERFEFFSPEEIDYEYVLADGKTMVNVGSVDESRDREKRASYVVLDDRLPDGVEPAEADCATALKPARISFRRPG
jgi:hypothetical protein